MSLRRTILGQLFPFLRFSKRVWIGWFSAEAKRYRWHPKGWPSPRGWINWWNSEEWWAFKDRAKKHAVFHRSPGRDDDVFEARVDGEIWRVVREKNWNRGEVDAWLFVVQDPMGKEDIFGVFSDPPDRWELRE